MLNMLNTIIALAEKLRRLSGYPDDNKAATNVALPGRVRQDRLDGAEDYEKHKQTRLQRWERGGTLQLSNDALRIRYAETADSRHADSLRVVRDRYRSNASRHYVENRWLERRRNDFSLSREAVFDDETPEGARSIFRRRSAAVEVNDKRNLPGDTGLKLEAVEKNLHRLNGYVDDVRTDVKTIIRHIETNSGYGVEL